VYIISNVYNLEGLYKLHITNQYLLGCPGKNLKKLPKTKTFFSHLTREITLTSVHLIYEKL